METFIAFAAYFSTSGASVPSRQPGCNLPLSFPSPFLLFTGVWVIARGKILELKMLVGEF